MKTLGQLSDTAALERRNRCYYLPAHPKSCRGADHRQQLPRKLALRGRGAGVGHALRLLVHDDISEGRADGRIDRTQLRLRLVQFEGVIDRLYLAVNGQVLPFRPDRRVVNSQDQEWLIFDDPRICSGQNTVLLLLEDSATPEPWPSLENCEILLLSDS